MKINKYDTKTNQLIESVVFVDGSDVYYTLEEKTDEYAHGVADTYAVIQRKTTTLYVDNGRGAFEPVEAVPLNRIFTT